MSQVWSNIVYVTVKTKVTVKSLVLAAERTEGYVGESMGFKVEAYLDAPAPFDVKVPVDVYVNDEKTTSLSVLVKKNYTGGRTLFDLTFKSPGTYKVQCSAPKEL